MPFRSEAQRRALWAKAPAVARKWTEKYGSKPRLKKKGKGK
jgi:hypothetical protein